MNSMVQKASDFLEKNMFTIAVISAAMLMFGLTAPMDAAYAEGGLKGVLTGVGTIGGTIGGIAMIVLLVKNIFEFVTGQGAGIGKILVNIFVLLLFVGLIAVAMNIDTIQGTFQGVANSAVDVVGDTASTALGGN